MSPAWRRNERVDCSCRCWRCEELESCWPSSCSVAPPRDASATWCPRPPESPTAATSFAITAGRNTRCGPASRPSKGASLSGESRGPASSPWLRRWRLSDCAAMLPQGMAKGAVRSLRCGAVRQGTESCGATAKIIVVTRRGERGRIRQCGCSYHDTQSHPSCAKADGSGRSGCFARLGCFWR
jgi:hypothetical protein